MTEESRDYNLRESNNEGSGYDDYKDGPSAARIGVLAMLDDFIYQVLAIRKLLFILFVSSIVLAPVSIVLSIYVFTHPSFDGILDAQDNFGEVLEILLVSIFASSSIWMVLGIKEYRSIGSWNKRYDEFMRVQKESEKRIMLKYGLSNGGED